VRHIALLRALTEAAQSRLTVISGTRDDASRHEYIVATEATYRDIMRRRALVEGVRDFSELSPRTFCAFPRELSSGRRTLPIRRKELSGGRERSMICPCRPRRARSSDMTTGFGNSSNAPGT
jgi:hypothetical protein